MIKVKVTQLFLESKYLLVGLWEPQAASVPTAARCPCSTRRPQTVCKWMDVTVSNKALLTRQPAAAPGPRPILIGENESHQELDLVSSHPARYLGLSVPDSTIGEVPWVLRL